MLRPVGEMTLRLRAEGRQIPGSPDTCQMMSSANLRSRRAGRRARVQQVERALSWAWDALLFPEAQCPPVQSEDGHARGHDVG